MKLPRPEPLALVLDVDCAHAELPRESRKRTQGRNDMVFAIAQESLDFLGRVKAEGLGVPRV